MSDHLTAADVRQFYAQTDEWAPDPHGVPRPLPPKDIYARERTRSVKPPATTPQRRRRWPWRRNEDT